MTSPLFKFCSAAGAASILTRGEIFITSPLDLNDPFEMRPGWTAEHEERRHLNEQRRSTLTAGMPMFAAMADGPPVYMGPTPQEQPQPAMDVESQRGISDGLNQRAFKILHERFRVLSLVSGLFDLVDSALPDDAELAEEATLMWSHYADQFQGVCLVLNPAAFENGIYSGGVRVQYPPERRTLPVSFYDSYLALDNTEAPPGFVVDAESGFCVPSTYKEDALRQAFIDLLMFKSPAWRYENEVRMIYDLSGLGESQHYRRVEIACEECRRRSNPPEKCKQALYRDAVQLPPPAILGVIFGADCPSVAVDRILEILAGAPFKEARLYWSSLHSARYAVHFMPGDAEYIRFFYQHRDSIVADAKGHVMRDGKSYARLPSRKGEMRDMTRYSADHVNDEPT